MISRIDLKIHLWTGYKRNKKGKSMTKGFLMKVKMACKEILYRCKPTIRIANTYDTISEIAEFRKSACRFGDCELSFALGIDEIGHQKNNPNLRNRLLEILKAGTNEKCLVCIPYALYSLKPFNMQSSIFWFKYCALYRDAFQLLPL